MLKRKLSKLRRDPILFFNDMAIKHKSKLAFLSPVRSSNNQKYTVISAVYNVEKYLDKFFESLTKQQLCFNKYIEIIIVDDGSTDNSAIIIKKWINKFPKNIKYIYKDNGGQGSARNLGLKYAKTEWVTYIDPDDFVDARYFKNIAKVIAENENLAMVSCNFIFYHENTGKISNSHPLKYRFKKNNKKQISNMDNMIQMHVNSVFFKKSIIDKGAVVFDGRLKPNFEDGHFVARYMEHCGNDFIYFCKDSIYFYRKRADSTSALDTSWSKLGKFSDVLEYGYLDLLNTYEKKYDKVPKNIQWTIIYELLWHFKYLLQKPERANFLTIEQKNKYIWLISSIFQKIDSKEIFRFNLAGAWFYHKFGILHAFKNDNPPFQIVYIESFDKIKRKLKVKYFVKNEFCDQNIYIDNNKTTPEVSKLVKHDFLDVCFCKEVISWIDIPKDSKFFHAKIANTHTLISVNGRNINGALRINDIDEAFNTNENHNIKSKYHNSWLFMDKDISADDNAEHFYRYIENNHPEINSFFIVKRGTKDWNRLYKDGFNLISFGSKKHRQALKQCRNLISSHADNYVTDFLGKDTLKGKRFIFLQHGVIKDDLSSWLNTKKQIDLLITTSRDEFDSICHDNTRYRLTSKEVVLTGLARHDALLKKSSNSSRTLLIMPTWRRNLLAGRGGAGSEFEKISNFTESEYFKRWNGLLSSQAFAKIIKKHKIDVIFSPHDYIKPYLECFDIVDGIRIASPQNTYQELLAEAAFMITDYSSVTFDMAIQAKPTFYFQFDSETFYSGTHNYTKGYFDYKVNGFGPVSQDIGLLLAQISAYLNKGMVIPKNIRNRINKFASLGDGKSCERIFNAIKSLE